jgi:8-oxo-dGTP pyrophosphatase MutT (NUDIX family)
VQVASNLFCSERLRPVKLGFPAGTLLPSEEYVDAAVRELFKEIGLTLTVDDLTLVSG